MFREKVLDVILGARMKPILNGLENSGSEDSEGIPAQVAESVHALKKAALMDDQGVKYDELKESQAYIYFKSTVAPALRRFDLSTLTTQADQLAFWINLYNLLTINAVVEFGIKKSVIEGWLGMLRFFRMAAYEIGGLRFNLEDIEHGILRANRGFLFHPGPQFGKDDPRRKFVVNKLDARIHFALNCASRSCPPIAFYTPENIQQQLDLAASNFIQENVVLDRSGVMLKLSRIFKWYQRDFGGKTGVLAMIRVHLPEGDLRRLLIQNFGEVTLVEYLRYDWRLNVLV